ncbi:MAG: FecR family protein [Bacteroidales bacterium]|nr:FecR family protein [Bacteroidales bacterium]MDD4669465.1 FecR family protein [Bacteroidales bacterium]
MKEVNNMKRDYLTDENIAALSSLMESSSDRDKALLHLSQFKKATEGKKHHGKISFRWMALASIAAAAVLCVCLLLFTNSQDDIPQMPEAYTVEVTAQPGENISFKLSDGTIVWLNSNSTIKYPNNFTAPQRRVELKGEAFFEVAPNKEIPFIVGTVNYDIKVTGTKFNVFAYNNDLFRTDLVDGSVTVYAPTANKSYKLKKNQSIIAESGSVVRTPLLNTDFLQLHNGIYSFDNVAFDEITKRLELYFGTTVTIENESLKHHKFSGKVRLEDGIEGILKTLKKIYKFRLEFDNNNIIIS